MNTLVRTMAAVAFLASPAAAQNFNAEADAAARASANSGSQAIAQGGGVYIAGTPAQTRSTQDVNHNYDGTYTVRNTPQVTPPSMSSGHPCAWAPASLGIGVVGLGASGGMQRIDDACLLGQMGLTTEAIAMIAARNPDACRILVSTGRISSQSYCGRGSRTVTSTRSPSTPAASVTPPARSQAVAAAAPAQTSIPRGSVTCGSPIKVASWARDQVSNATAIAFCSQ